MTERDKLFSAFQAGAVRHGLTNSGAQIERSFAQWYTVYLRVSKPKPRSESVFDNHVRVKASG